MRKLFTFLFAMLMSAGMFAARDIIPDDALIKSLTDYTCKVCIYVEDDCNDVYFVGSYNGWNYNPNSSALFAPVPGYSGWYVTSFDDFDSDVIEGVPVVDKGDGVIEAAYMIGAFEGIRGSVEAVKAGDVITKLTNFDGNQPNVFFVNAWKTNPCAPAPPAPPTPVATPVISGDEEFEESTTITITCVTEGAKIYYTLDGSDPTSSGTEYSAPFEITETTTVKAVASIPMGGFYSEVAEMTFTKAAPAETVVILNQSHYAGENKFTNAGVTLEMKDVTEGAWNLEGPGTFTNSLGKNFIKIEVTTESGQVMFYGEGWTGDVNGMTWTGNAASVSIKAGDDCGIWGMGDGFTITCTLGEPATAIENVQGDQVPSTKILLNGQLLIEKNGTTINVLGQPVR